MELREHRALFCHHRIKKYNLNHGTQSNHCNSRARKQICSCIHSYMKELLILLNLIVITIGKGDLNSESKPYH